MPALTTSVSLFQRRLTTSFKAFEGFGLIETRLYDDDNDDDISKTHFLFFLIL